MRGGLCGVRGSEGQACIASRDGDRERLGGSKSLLWGEGRVFFKGVLSVQTQGKLALTITTEDISPLKSQEVGDCRINRP